MNSARSLHELVGLSTTESAILQVLQTPKPIRLIQAETEISRTGITYCLAYLLKRGFARIIRNGKRKSYIALSPTELVDHIQLKLDEARSSRHQKGARVRTTKEDEFIIHVGAKEIIPAYSRIASENKNERIRAIQHHKSYNELMEKITPKQLIEFNKTIIKNKLIIDGILNESAYRDYAVEVRNNPSKFKAQVESLQGRMADYAFFADSWFNHFAEIWIFKNTTLIINWHDEVAIEITNRSMTAFLKDMFEFVKKDGQKIDHNKVMRHILSDK